MTSIVSFEPWLPSLFCIPRAFHSSVLHLPRLSVLPVDSMLPLCLAGAPFLCHRLAHTISAVLFPGAVIQVLIIIATNNNFLIECSATIAAAATAPALLVIDDAGTIVFKNACCASTTGLQSAD